MNPKLGKIDIDYEVLHDAFFRHQIKPKMTIHGDTYFEGKEDEVKMRSYKPGKISDELRQALGISEYSPPPWLISMQRFGPPPSYPHLKIPGLNTSLADPQYFYFNKNGQDDALSKFMGNFGGYNRGMEYQEEVVDKGFWGDPCDDIEDDDMLSQAGIENEVQTNTDVIDYTNRSGVTSIVSGIETPGFTDIRKQAPASLGEEDTDAGSNSNSNAYNQVDRPLYQVLEQNEAKDSKGLLASEFGYKIPEDRKY